MWSIFSILKKKGKNKAKYIILENVDRDRMDIFDTIIRTVINSTELPFINAITLLRDWESITRNQLSQSTKPGHLFSPIELPEDF